MCPNIEKDLGIAAANYIRNGLKFFLDDGSIMLDETLITADQLLSYLNNMNQNIQFTMETSHEKIPFLDVLIILTKDLKNTNLYHVSTDIYHKPTDTFSYFPFTSCAPRHISRNIPYNLARRVMTIVSDQSTREKRFDDLKLRLLAKNIQLI